MNAVQKQVNYRGVTREISDKYWNDEILPLLYPNWDTDKDKLINFHYLPVQIITRGANGFPKTLKIEISFGARE